MLGISVDSVESHKRFKAKFGFLNPLLSDVDKKVTTLYGVLNEKGTRARRSIFIIDKEGIIRFINPRYQVNKKEQYEEIFRVLSEI